MSPKGRAYITLGAGGFSYRQNLTPSSPRRQQTPPSPIVPGQPAAGKIVTAEVKQLLQSSRGELIETLNHRARMFNPATALFLLAAVAGLFGIVQLQSGTTPQPLPSLPDTSVPLDASRQANQMDEYALFIARYGQPSSIQLSEVGNVPERMATFAGAHLNVTFVPVACADAYAFYETHKSDSGNTRNHKRSQSQKQVPAPTTPPCAPPANNATTVVEYRDTESDSPVTAATAASDLALLTVKSTVPPTIQLPVPAHLKKGVAALDQQTKGVTFDQNVMQTEQRRLEALEMSGKSSVKTGGTAFAIAFVLLLPGVYVHRKNKEKRTTQLIYDLSGSAQAQQALLENALARLSSSQKFWRLDSQAAVSDWKRNAGAAYNVKRENAAVRKALPPRVESNVEPTCVDLGKLKMFFLPDQVLYWQHGTFASLDYQDLNFHSGSTQFIEEQVQASDSQQVGTTWRYVRRDGGPDRRFNNNRQLPIMVYGVLTANTPSGLNLVFHTSNAGAANTFVEAFRSYQAAVRRRP